MAHAGNGGLQRHSIGESYPWTVIGTVDENGITQYYPANLITGQQLARVYSCSLAHDYAQTAHDQEINHG